MPAAAASAARATRSTAARTAVPSRSDENLPSATLARLMGWQAASRSCPVPSSPASAEASGLQPAIIGSSDGLRIGRHVVVIGNAVGPRRRSERYSRRHLGNPTNSKHPGWR